MAQKESQILQITSSETCSQKREKDEAELFKSDTEDEEFNGY